LRVFNLKKYIRLITIGLILALLIFIAIPLFSDIQTLIKNATTFPWWIMIPVLALRMVNWTIRFFKWHFYLHVVGVRNLRLVDSAAIFVTGFPLAASPGKVAEIVKSFLVKSLTGTPVPATLPVIAAERVSDGFAVVLLTLWAMANLPETEQFRSVVAVAFIMPIIGVTILQIRPLCYFVLHILERLPLIGRFAYAFEHMYESSTKITSLPSILFSVGTGLAANVLDGVGVFLILVGLGEPATADTFFRALFVISLSVIVGSLSGMPGGVGASDLTISGAMRIVIRDFTVAQAGFATLLARFVQFWWGVLVGSLVAILMRKRLFTPELEHVIEEEQEEREKRELEPAIHG
jgi:glycosyltransferase 2 family protein